MLGLALAGPLPNPGRSTQESLVWVDAIGSSSERDWRVNECSGERCVSTMSDAHGALRLGLRPIDPLALWVDARYGRAEASGSGHSGAGLGGAAGLSLVWPGERLRPALSAQLSMHQSTATAAGSVIAQDAETQAASGDRSTSSQWLLQVNPLLVWGSGAQGATLWFGPELVPWGEQTLDMQVDEVRLAMSPDERVGILVGAELRSDALGKPGQRPSYLSAGAQLQAMAGAGIYAWIGWSL